MTCEVFRLFSKSCDITTTVPQLLKSCQQFTKAFLEFETPGHPPQANGIRIIWLHRLTLSSMRQEIIENTKQKLDYFLFHKSKNFVKRCQPLL